MYLYFRLPYLRPYFLWLFCRVCHLFYFVPNICRYFPDSNENFVLWCADYFNLLAVKLLSSCNSAVLKLTICEIFPWIHSQVLSKWHSAIESEASWGRPSPITAHRCLMLSGACHLQSFSSGVCLLKMLFVELNINLMMFRFSWTIMVYLYFLRSFLRNRWPVSERRVCQLRWCYWGWGPI